MWVRYVTSDILKVSRECYFAKLTNEDCFCFCWLVIHLIMYFCLIPSFYFFYFGITRREEEESVGSAVDGGVGNLKWPGAGGKKKFCIGGFWLGDDVHLKPKTVEVFEQKIGSCFHVVFDLILIVRFFEEPRPQTFNVQYSWIKYVCWYDPQGILGKTPIIVIPYSNISHLPFKSVCVEASTGWRKFSVYWNFPGYGKFTGYGRSGIK